MIHSNKKKLNRINNRTTTTTTTPLGHYVFFLSRSGIWEIKKNSFNHPLMVDCNHFSFVCLFGTLYLSLQKDQVYLELGAPNKLSRSLVIKWWQKKKKKRCCVIFYDNNDNNKQATNKPILSRTNYYHCSNWIWNIQKWKKRMKKERFYLLFFFLQTRKKERKKNYLWCFAAFREKKCVCVWGQATPPIKNEWPVYCILAIHTSNRIEPSAH